ncbi:hypothetical protein [Hyphococcus sp.]|uniref:hypothetical protein n=1 Tax=Hyphococcus sp. TaxID=2038636 RepID=UPI0035C68C9D
MTHGTDNSQTHLQEDLLKIGAEHTRFGLGVGIFVSLLIIAGGLIFIFGGFNGFTNGAHAEDPAGTYAIFAIGIALVLFGSILASRQVKMRDQINEALRKPR